MRVFAGFGTLKHSMNALFYFVLENPQNEVSLVNPSHDISALDSCESKKIKYFRHCEAICGNRQSNPFLK